MYVCINCMKKYPMGSALWDPKPAMGDASYKIQEVILMQQKVTPKVLVGSG